MEQPLPQGTGTTRDAPGANPSTIRGSAIGAGLGGLLLVVHAVILALKPPGFFRTGPEDLILFLAALALIGAAAVGIFRMHRFEGRGSRVVRIAALVAAVSLWIGAILTNFSALYFVGLAAFVLAIFAFAVTGAGLMRSRVVPGWSGAVLILTSLLLLGANGEDERILFLVPFGLTWMVLGGLLWFAAVSPSSGWHAHIQHA